MMMDEKRKREKWRSESERNELSENANECKRKGKLVAR